MLQSTPPTGEKLPIQQLTLAQACTNDTCVFAGLHQDVPAGQRRRLAELGLRNGCTLRVVQKTAGGGIVVSCGATRYALDKATASQISVEVGQP